MNVIRVRDGAELAVRASALLDGLIDAALRERGRAHVALAGGTTPGGAYRLLAPAHWDRVELWFGDERCVGPDDPQSNYRMVAETLLPGAAGASVHRIEGELGAERAADAYDALLRALLPAGPAGAPLLDVAVLGIGEDGHTASLFPHNPALAATGRSVVPVHDAPKPPPDRVSLTLEVLRAARACVLLASGAGKASPLALAMAGPDPAVPSSLLEHERLHIVADEAALGGAGAR